MAQEGKSVMCQGRIVWTAGDLFTGRVKTEFGTQIPKLSKTGEQMKEYGFGLAVPKTALSNDPGNIWAEIHNEAFTLYPSRQLPPQFAMKYKDGDGVDDKGVSFTQREGYAGHIVFACTTTLPIKYFKYENGQNILINQGIKCGDYVNVQLQIKAHAASGPGKPGLYLNPNAVQFLGYGKEIVNAPSGDQVFGNQAPAMPPGASATPIAPAGMLVPPSQVGAPQYAQPAMPQQPPQPHYATLPPQFQPQPGAQPAPQYQQPAMPPQQQAPQGVPGFPVPGR